MEKERILHFLFHYILLFFIAENYDDVVFVIIGECY